ncbi:M67 family metallopeptidase [Sphingobium lactosutens]|uniref:Peptidase n=1 Tax=Sphingobium lactosutens DS20 TaxID=1331060 RepID=T0HH56_9SPHN|nr:Mov34/MPN/PAD-1 family protein [Sphingobium lactosutens]EQB11478.1 peptidase [Sphingobium lactosutens DS20]
MKVEIARGVLAQIRALSAADRNEVCGLLLGSAGRIDALAPAANVASDPSRHFELDPAVLIAAHRAARNGGPVIIGHYHSHPSGVAVPSATDTACAAPDGALWLIVADGVARLWVAGPGEGGAVRFAEAKLDMR